MAVRRVASRRSRPQRRQFIWARASSELSTVGTTLQTNLLGQFETDYGANLVGATIVRIRGLLIWRPVDLTTDHRLVVAAQIGMSGSLAAANGPVTAATADWFLYEPFQSARSSLAPASSADTFERLIDVKSMRRLEELHQEAQLIAEGDVTGHFLGYDLSIGLKLP